MALRPKFEGNNLRSKDPSYIAAPRSTPSLRPQNSNREPKLLETGLTITKHSPATRSNREKTRVSHTSFLPSRRQPFRPQPPATEDRIGIRPWFAERLNRHPLLRCTILLRSSRTPPPRVRDLSRFLFWFFNSPLESRSKIRDGRAKKSSKTPKNAATRPPIFVAIKNVPEPLFCSS